MQTIPSRPSPPTPPEPKNHTEHESSPIRRDPEEVVSTDALGMSSPRGEVRLEVVGNKLVATEDSKDINSESQLLSPNSHTSTNSTLVIDVAEVPSPSSSSDDLSDAGRPLDMKPPASAEELFDSLKNSGVAEAAAAVEGAIADGGKSLEENREMKQKICDILVSLDKDVEMGEEENEKQIEAPRVLESAQLKVTEKSAVGRKRNEGRMRTIFEKENEDSTSIASLAKENETATTMKKSRMANALQMLNHQSEEAAPGAVGGEKAGAGPKLYFEIESQDGFTYRSTSINDVWAKVFEGVQASRKAYGLCSLPEGPLGDMGGFQMLGLKANPLRYLLEQLPGVEVLKKYQPKYHQMGTNGFGGGGPGAPGIGGGKEGNGLSLLYQTNGNPVFNYGGGADVYEELKENPFGAARCEAYCGRSEYDMFSWLASRHRKQPAHVMVQSDEAIIPR